jgi:hypothetical protein
MSSQILNVRLSPNSDAMATVHEVREGQQAACPVQRSSCAHGI